MGGHCGDYVIYLSGGQTTALAATLPNSGGLCLVTQGSHSGLITYDDGRTVRLVPDHEPVPNPQVSGQFLVDIYSAPTGDATRTISLPQARLDFIRLRQQTEIGVCYNNVSGIQVQPLPLVVNGTSPITWTPRHETGLLSLFRNQPNNVFFCVDAPTADVIGVNTSSGQGFGMRSAMQTLKDSSRCQSVLGPDSAAQCQVLRGVADSIIPAEQNHTRELIWVGVVFTIVGIVGHIFGHWWNNRGGPRGGSGSGGGGGGDPIDFMALGARMIQAGWSPPVPAAQPAQPAAAPQGGPQSSARVVLVEGGNDLLLDTLGLGASGPMSTGPQGIDALDTSRLPSGSSTLGGTGAPLVPGGAQVPAVGVRVPVFAF